MIKYAVVLLTAVGLWTIADERRYIVDGDTIVVGRETIRLNGIDAPETGQTCTCQGETVMCGIVAKDNLYNFIGSNPVSCKVRGRDPYGRHVGQCFMSSNGEETDLNLWMVQNGNAMAFSKYTDIFLEDEAKAIQKKTGFWNCEVFNDPSSFRKSYWNAKGKKYIPEESPSSVLNPMFDPNIGSIL